jgi:hypothetical protein
MISKQTIGSRASNSIMTASSCQKVMSIRQYYDIENYIAIIDGNLFPVYMPMTWKQANTGPVRYCLNMPYMLVSVYST